MVVSEELLARVDAARGDVPRSAWLRRTVERALGPVAGERPPTLEEFLDKNEVEYRRSVEQPEAGVLEPFVKAADGLMRPGVRPAREFRGSYDPFKKR